MRGPDSQNRGAKHFKQESADEDLLGQTLDLPYAGYVDAFAQDLTVSQSHAAPHEKKEERGDGHEAKASDLDQDQNNDLPEDRPVKESILYDQTRHAGRGSSGEKAGQKPGAAAGTGSQRQHEQDRARYDHK